MVFLRLFPAAHSHPADVKLGTRQRGYDERRKCSDQGMNSCCGDQGRGIRLRSQARGGGHRINGGSVLHCADSVAEVLPHCGALLRQNPSITERIGEEP